jgi:hypothetical protein
MKLTQRIRGLAEVADYMDASDANFVREVIRILAEAGHVTLVDAEPAKSDKPVSAVLKKHFGQWMGAGK